MAFASLRWVALALVPIVIACEEPASTGFVNSRPLDCSIPQGEIFDGGPGKDGIPALTNPTLVAAQHPDAGYLRPQDRVIGIRDQGEVIAIPLNILWWHEIVNIAIGGVALAVTHCPLTGSSLAFDRVWQGNAEFGVSGLLYKNNLMMYDRRDPESLWPQMTRAARCGPQDGVSLTMFPVVETTWEWWATNHPDTRVVSSETGYTRNYVQYPYGEYRVLDNSHTLFPVDIDPRRPPKERVLGVPGPAGGVAYPFGELARLGNVAAVDTGPSGSVILWDAAGQAAMAYEAVAESTALSFTVIDDEIVDNETGSVWRVDGVAVSGPLAGSQLEPVTEAYVAYWFAWAAFESDTELWSAP